MVDFTESIFQINKGNNKITLFLADMIDDICENFSVFIAARLIVSKSLLNVTFDVLIFSYKVIKSISDDGCQGFRHNRLHRYWTKVGGISIEAFFVSKNGESLFPGFGEFSSGPRR